jgi:hypothetical protein
VRIVIVIHTWMIMMTGVGKENKKEKKRMVSVATGV